MPAIFCAPLPENINNDGVFHSQYDYTIFMIFRLYDVKSHNLAHVIIYLMKIRKSRIKSPVFLFILLLTSCLLTACAQVGNSDPSRPNIILILTDDQPNHTMAYMPNVQKELVAHGVTFNNAFSTTPLCCPSRASILTGQYVFHHGVKTNRLPDGGALKFNDVSSLPVWLHDAGYRTALMGKYLNGANDMPEGYIPPGWDEWQVFMKRDPDLAFYYEYSLSENGKTVDYGREEQEYSTDLLTKKAVQFIRDSGDQPFFLMLSVFAPHETYQAAVRHKDLFKTDAEFERYRPPSYYEADLGDKPGWVSQIEPADQDYVDHVYERILRSLMAVDDSVGVLVDTLEERRIRDNTVIIFMSDNGVSMGENGIFGKNCGYDPCLHVPLVISDPALQIAARRDDQFALNIDIAPTIMDLAGLEIPDTVDGQSLLPLLQQPSMDWRDGFMIEHYQDKGDSEESALAAIIPGYSGYRTREWKYIEYDSGERELYDLINDPYEMNNLIDKDGYDQIILSLQLQLQELKSQ
jgi:N-acetylglucosamine-6-sulfatase